MKFHFFVRPRGQRGWRLKAAPGGCAAKPAYAG